MIVGNGRYENHSFLPHSCLFGRLSATVGGVIQCSLCTGPPPGDDRMSRRYLKMVKEYYKKLQELGVQ